MDIIQTKILNPLHPYLKPITTSLPTPVDNFILTLLGAPCHSALLYDLDLTTHPECVSLAISKALGIGIIAAASVVKIPQLLKLVRSHSATGLSFSSYALETTAFLITLAYNIRSSFPVSTYGETALILAQDLAIGALILHYQSRPVGAATFVLLVSASLYALLGPQSPVTSSQMRGLQTLAGLLSLASKVPQIWTNYQQGGTGQLSAFAVFNYVLGSASRIFTTLAEVDDPLILWSFVAGFVLNAVLAVQMVWYWNSTNTAGHGKEVGLSKNAVGQAGKAGAKVDVGSGSAIASGLAGDNNNNGSSSEKRPGSSSGSMRRRG